MGCPVARRVPFILLALALYGVGCSRDVGRAANKACPELDAGRVVDPTLLAFLGRARAAHHAADAHEERGEPERAVATLESLLSGPAPGGNPTAPEVREVLGDTHARLADLESRRQRFAQAEHHVEAGLGFVPESSYFRGHLFEVRGLLEERRAAALKDAGNETASEQARQRALQAFEQSMDIQAEVIRRSTSGEKPR